jgi:hypothetical protein
MGRELIRRATIALQHAAEARTVEFQARHAEEARTTFEHALRSARARFEAAESRASAAAQVIARQSVASELIELSELETRLIAIEARIATAILERTDPRDFRHFRLAD